MAKALYKSQVVAAIADKHALSTKQAAGILASIADLAFKNAKNTFTLPGLGWHRHSKLTVGICTSQFHVRERIDRPFKCKADSQKGGPKSNFFNRAGPSGNRRPAR